MSRFGSGFGKDSGESHPGSYGVYGENQRLANTWFQRDSSGNRFKDDRPEWWRGKRSAAAPRPPSPTRLGEWQLVWRPHGAPTPPGPKPRSAKQPPPKSGRDHQELLQRLSVASAGPEGGHATQRKARYHTSGSMTGILDTGGMVPPGGRPPRPASVAGDARSVYSDRDSVASACSSRKGLRLPVGRASEVEEIASQPANSARSQHSTVSARSGYSRLSEASSGRRKELRSSASSVRSQSSVGTYSGLSGVSSRLSNQTEILSRIQGLEDALRAEKQLRHRMQTLLETQTGATLERVDEH